MYKGVPGRELGGVIGGDDPAAGELLGVWRATCPRLRPRRGRGEPHRGIVAVGDPMYSADSVVRGCRRK